MTPAEEVKRLRNLLRWSQAKFAEQLGVDTMTVSRWERGFHTPGRFTLEAIRRMVKAELTREKARP